MIATARAMDFERLGYAIVPDVVTPERVRSIACAIDSAGEGEGILRRQGTLFGMRDALRRLPAIRTLANSTALLGLVRPVLGPDASAVRALLFDKTSGANWGVAWHQDLTIAVKERVDAPGFGPWTVKAGIAHVRPPAGVLEGMVTLRVHLDDCGPDSGPLRVLPGSHRDGILGGGSSLRAEGVEPVTCLVDRGGILMMRPLLIHGSSPAVSPTRRRVLHLEYAAAPLPGGLDWFEPEAPR